MKKRYPIIIIKKINPFFYKSCKICGCRFRKEEGYFRSIVTLEDVFDGFFFGEREVENKGYFCKDCFNNFRLSIEQGCIRI
jgi:hypothetical protein